MIFRKKSSVGTGEKADSALNEETLADVSELSLDDLGLEADEVAASETADSDIADGEPIADDFIAELDDDSEDDDSDKIDYRAAGPFDFDEVELGDAERLDLGTLIVTPSEHIGLQLRVNKESNVIEAIMAIYGKSALEISIFAAPVTGSVLQRLKRDLIDEAEDADGQATGEDGPFGQQLRLVIPAEGKKGQQTFRVSRVWLVEGPRWVLRGALLGAAAIGDATDEDQVVLAAFFRNLVVRRGNKPIAPGDLIGMELADGVQNVRV